MANHTDWLNISTMSGSSGRTILSLTANTNTQGTDKVAIVKAYNPALNVSATTTVRISAYTPYITVSPDYVGIAASGGTYQLSIQANCSYNISYPEMVTDYSASSGVGNTNITFTVPNNTAQDTIVGTIVFTDTTGQYSTTVRLEQYAQGVSILYNPTAITLPYYGGDASFYVSANCAYSISAGSGTWYSVSPQTGYTGETEFVISAPNSNTGNTNWTDSINIVGPEGIAAVIPVTQLNWGQYHFDYTADTSNIAYSGEQRTITLDITDTISSSITIDIVGAPDVTYTYSDSGTSRIITVNVPQNPGLERTFKVVVRGKKTSADNYSTALIEYTQNSLQLDFVTDTSNVAGVGEVRTITILTSNINPNRTGLNLPSDFPQTGSYTVSGNVITLTYPANPSSSASRTWTIRVLAQTNDGVSLSGSYQITQNAYGIYPIPYTGDTSEVAATGETRVITIDASNLIPSSITIGVVGATGVTYTYDNGVITISFPENFGGERDITLSIDGKTTNGDKAEADITFSQEGADLRSTPLTFNILSGGTIVWKTSNSAYTRTIEYSKNNGNWTSITSSTDGASIRVDTGDIVRFRGNNAAYALAGKSCSFSGSTAKFDVQGNIMSLIDSDDFSSLVTLQSAYTFAELFNNCTGLTSAENLVLPATRLANGCYQGMFAGCTSLTSAPVLPATTLASNCYYGMFAGCSSLTTAPALSATTLVGYCYGQMFWHCTSLITAPELSAATLAEGCYANMFEGCTTLNYIKCLATDISASYCTNSWVNGVAPTGTFEKNTSMEDWTIGNNGIPIGWTVKDKKDYLKEYLTFNILSAGTIVWATDKRAAYTTTIEYSTDSGETWTSITSNTGDSAPSITVNNGDVVQFRGGNTTYSSGSSYNSFNGSTAKFEVEGNIMSLIDSTNFAAATTLASSFNFFYLFRQCTGLTSAENLMLPATRLTEGCYRDMFNSCINLTTAPELPATTLARGCYMNMFSGCRSLTSAPALPATTLAKSCYAGMFGGCTSLTTAPELPVTTLAEVCYWGMFNGCTNLTTAPVLPATTLANDCYMGMFNGCTSLTKAPELPVTTLTRNCYNYMFQGCTSLTTAPVLPATTLASECYSSMFSGCRSLTTAPTLPATTLAYGCYRSMFSGCTGLTTAPALPATSLKEDCYRDMFNGCTNLTTAPELPATELEYGFNPIVRCYSCYEGMFNGCTSLTAAPALPATTLVKNCYYKMFSGCTSLTTAPVLPATTLASDCYFCMFQGCTSLTSAPVLPATTLVERCYYYMFQGCTNLNYIKCLTTNISASNCTYNWVDGVAATGTFVTPSSTNWSTGVSGIPEGWTRVDA